YAQHPGGGAIFRTGHPNLYRGGIRGDTTPTQPRQARGPGHPQGGTPAGSRLRWGVYRLRVQRRQAPSPEQPSSTPRAARIRLHLCLGLVCRAVPRAPRNRSRAFRQKICVEELELECLARTLFHAPTLGLEALKAILDLFLEKLHQLFGLRPQAASPDRLAV